ISEIRPRLGMVDLIRRKDLSRNVLMALGHSPEDPLKSIVEEERSLIWKLVEVQKIVGLKGGDGT
ncbi:MAG TPA: pyridoxamine 5'-phosphate oxidase family protein, partial [Methanothrix sp.]|nr:pyridoxamine 5'-phosphate oxidase family protein [Methanothrix sp.]